MLRQRVNGLALGWEDLSDHGTLREDVAMQTAIGVEREVASAPTLCRLENGADKRTAWRLHQVLIDQFIASFKQAPQELVLDFDATDNSLHGQQEGREGLDRTRTVSELVARANELPTLLQP